MATSLVSVDNFWKTDDPKRVSALIHRTCRYQHFFALKRDTERFDEATNLLKGMLDLYDLVAVFRANPHATISEIGTIITERTGKELSRNGVYFRLAQVGLDAHDLRNPHNTLYDLIIRSKVLGPKARRIQKARLPKTIGPAAPTKRRGNKPR